MAETATKLPIQGADETAATPPARRSDWPSFADLRREMDTLFDDFSRTWFRAPGGRAEDLARTIRRATGFDLQPAVDVTETDGGYRITAELPGVDQKNVEVRVAGDRLTVSGRKEESREETEKGSYLSERRYGAFQRSFTLPTDVDRDAIEATYANGVLTVQLPRSADAKAAAKTIEVKAA